jgi:hypothetical protein
MQGEYLGGNVPHLIFVGRRGQPFFWSPFENDAGNHNVAICGRGFDFRAWFLSRSDSSNAQQHGRGRGYDTVCDPCVLDNIHNPARRCSPHLASATPQAARRHVDRALIRSWHALPHLMSAFEKLEVTH